MKKQFFAIGAVAAMSLLLSTVPARATLYNFTFTGGSSAANGQLDVNGGVATGGFLDVTAGTGIGTYSLFTWNGGGVSSVRVNGTDLIVDNLVSPGSTPFLDVYGLAFVNNLANPTEGMDFSLNFGTTYNLGGFGTLGYYVPNSDGRASIELAAVPEPTSLIAGSMLLLPFGARSLRKVRDRFAPRRSA